ncbi:MAG TPA: hypothetical protein VFJ43_00625 [Bacteroidia bacterium]|nr:hypothetical protein [Bacteroidia bacterium]
MKKIFFLFVLMLPVKFVSAQDAATTHAEFNSQGKTYIADYDNAKHVLKMNEEVSFEIYDETGSCIKRSEGLTVDFKPILKSEEKTFTVRFYRKSKTSKSKKSASIKQKGEIGVMVIKDQK